VRKACDLPANVALALWAALSFGRSPNPHKLNGSAERFRTSGGKPLMV